MSDNYRKPAFVIILGVKLLAAEVGGDLNCCSPTVSFIAEGLAEGFFGVVGAAIRNLLFFSGFVCRNFVMAPYLY